LNYFVDNFSRIAEWRSHVERLLEFEAVLGSTAESVTEAGEATTIVLADSAAEDGVERLRFENLQIIHPNETIMLADTNTQIAKGERVLIVGPSGSGKSTLFRAIAGLWPWGTGMMFMPQRPYLPLGTLRAAVSYPAPAHEYSDGAVKMTLQRCGLEHLLDRLD